MALHIKDEAASEAVRRLAAARGVSLTAAVRLACQEALARDANGKPVAERLADVHRWIRQAEATGQRADKAFFDAEWGD
jgi:antitoxin VapB